MPLSAILEKLATDPAPRALRDGLALVIALLALLAGAVAFAYGEPASGVYLGVADDRIVIERIGPWSDAWASGLEEGMVVVRFNGRDLIDYSVDGFPVRPVDPDPDLLSALVDGEPVRDLEAMDPRMYDELGSPGVEATSWGYWTVLGWALDNSAPAVLLGLAILGGAAWFVRRGHAGESLRPLAVPVAVALAVPLLVLPLDLVRSIGFAPATVLILLALLPLADGMSGLIEDAATRARVRIATGIAAASAATIVLVVPAVVSLGQSEPAWREAAIVAIPLIPAVVAGRPRLETLADGPSSSRRVVVSTELLLVAVTPAVAALTLLFPAYEPMLWPIVLWLLALVVAARFTIRPLLRLATRAQLQRDLVVAAMEAERARLAADLHDDALQDLTLLVRRLDAAGDAEGAAQARAVADRLRDICGDLRLPILDDLGVGPALDWLVERIERLAGGEVRLERVDEGRPPAAIELAVFRVAQEALSNAVRHGRPPIVVRYRATGSGVSLSIDDAGPGIDADARERATAGGHFGLLNMQQRAEGIGAILDVRRWPSGGTHVALEWRAG